MKTANYNISAAKMLILLNN